MSKIIKLEIQGLRAIAVLAVIFYHAEIKINENLIFEGGFLGVDIFFVISGYLITSIIFKELFLTSSFNFYNFFIKRVKRILPALLFLMIVFYIVSYYIFLPDDFINFSKTTIFSIFFSVNYFFITLI